MEKPILFSTLMVQAILDGRKTMTRRIVKHNNHSPLAEVIPVPRILELEKDWGKYRITWESGADGIINCPYGKPGDVLWVRETHALEKYGSEIICAYKASCDNGEFDFVTDDGSVVRAKVKRWRPAIHMLKETARIWLEVVSVKVERLQEITEQDAIAEGMPLRYDKDEDGLVIYDKRNAEAFETLWSDINGPDSWNANPWVWVIEFKRIETHIKK